MSRPFDVIVFGATGFTGKQVVKELCAGSKVKMGIAGRSKERLEGLLSELGMNKDTGVIVADVKNAKSVEDMCKACKVLINCVGPYRFYGDPVVKACVDNKTDYVDISGEPYFMEKAIGSLIFKAWLDYNDRAERNGTVVISACGFDSIPADLGLELTRLEFKKEGLRLASSQSILNFVAEKGGSIHFTTFESAVYGFKNVGDLSQLRKQINYPKLPHTGKKLPRHVLPFTFKAN